VESSYARMRVQGYRCDRIRMDGVPMRLVERNARLVPGQRLYLHHFLSKTWSRLSARYAPNISI
jgi:hypothetical protein